jgi:hypothetical protein
MLDRCDLVIEPWPGESITTTFQEARTLAALLRRPVRVRGNGVDVQVTADMDDATMQAAYERALVAR